MDSNISCTCRDLDVHVMQKTLVEYTIHHIHHACTVLAC